MTEIKLSDGKAIPAVGLGTFRSKSEQAYNSALHALEVGYRHIDTAEAYGNEEQVGRAVKDSSVPRNEVFITSKLWNTHWTEVDATAALEESLKKLGTDYLDLYLVHWPGSDERIRAVWPALESALDAGKVRSIGVSNFHVHRLNMLLENSRVRPVVNQVECHPHLQNSYLLNYCTQNGIVMEAYAPLNSDHIQDLLQDKKLGEIAEAHNKTVPQVVLRWHIQRGVVPLPKSVTKSRIRENFQLFDFELSADEMAAIRRLNRAARHFPDPDDADFGFPVD